MPVKENKYVLFSVAKQLWAMKMRIGTRFVSCENILRVPGMDEKVVGLSYSGGEVVTILDTAKIVNSKSHYETNDNICLLFDYNQDRYAMLVDGGDETIESPKVMTDEGRKPFSQYIKYNGNNVYIIDPESIWKILKIYD